MEILINVEMPDINNVINWGMLAATILMALFAFLSWITAIQQKKTQKKLMREQQISQEKLLNQQNDIQFKQLQLSLLKEKQEIRENFRNLIIEERNKIDALIYYCKKMTLNEFRKNMSKNYVIIMKIRDLFDRQLERDIKKIIENFENILSYETSEITKLKIFENGVEHKDREQMVSNTLLKKYKEIHNNNIMWSIAANGIFIEILQKMDDEINKITNKLKS